MMPRIVTNFNEGKFCIQENQLNKKKAFKQSYSKPKLGFLLLEVLNRRNGQWNNRVSVEIIKVGDVKLD